jgi:hypothetical protein
MTDRIESGTEPTDGIEAVRRIWCAVLDLEDVSPDANFFDEGGSSVLVLLVQERLEQLVGRPVPVEDLFHHSTIRAQAGYLFAPASPPAPPAGRAPDRGRLLGQRGRSRPAGAGAGDEIRERP